MNEIVSPPVGSGKLDLPPLGFRNYWYPALAAWRLRRKPRSVELLGERIVLFRDKEKVFALADRCTHRGARLSMGSCLFHGSGTISCPYHGWTFDGSNGRCVAKLIEGPNAVISDQAAVRAFSVREYAGLIWVFVGDMDAVPLEDDLPEPVAETSQWHSIANWRTYKSNWTLLMDNLAHDQHAPFLHRNSPELVLQPIFKHATQNAVMPLENGKGIGHVAQNGITAADYPGLGRFPPPREEWHRFLKPTGRGKDVDPTTSAANLKYGIVHRHMNLMPSIAMIGRPSGDFFTCRWIVPVDEDTTILFNINLFRRQGALKTFLDRVKWIFWMSWAHDWLFSDQDKWIVEAIEPGKDRYSGSDVGVVGWRRFAIRNARRPISDRESAVAPSEILQASHLESVAEAIGHA